MKRFIAIAIILFIVVSAEAAGWFKSSKTKQDEDYQSTCRHYQRYVFDLRFWGKIDPQQFLQWAQFLQNAYSSGKFDDTAYNKMLLSSLLELPQLMRCTQNNYNKFEQAGARTSVMQNASAFVKQQLNLFEKRCLDWQHQRLYRPPEGSMEEGGPWPTTPKG